MPDPPLVRPVGASTVPEAPHPDEDAALGHLGRDGLVVLEGVGWLVAQMAARDQARGPVLLGEVGDGPHGVADDGDVGPGQGDQLVVGVHGLGLFARPDRDGGERRDQEPRVEDALDDREDVGVHRDLLEGRPVDEQVVDPHRVDPFEQVVGRHGAQIVLQLEQRLVDLVDQVGFDGAGEDGVPVLGDPPEMLFQVRKRAGGRGLLSQPQLYGHGASGVVPGTAELRRSELSGGRVWENGPLAQLVAHLHDTQGVRGSSPLRPTIESQLRGEISSEHLPQNPRKWRM